VRLGVVNQKGVKGWPTNTHTGKGIRAASESGAAIRPDFAQRQERKEDKEISKTGWIVI